MKLFKLPIAVLILFFSSVCAASAATITDNGKPTAIILLSPKPVDCAKKAADELKDFVKQMSGATLPVGVASGKDIKQFTQKWKTVILLGDTEAARELGIKTDDLKPDGFHILVKDNVIAVVGNDSSYYDQIASRSTVKAGTLYGVYRLLELMGIRFYQQDNTLIPQKKTITLDNMDLTVNPYFPYRISEVMVDPWFRRIGYGADRDPWASRHSFHYWYKRFAQTHPEYFCLDANGKSDLYYPAFTHKGVIEQMAADAKKHFGNKSLPDGRRKYFQVLPNDYFMQMCSCKKCQSLVDTSRPKIGWYSDYVAQGVINVANLVKNDFPDCYIVYGAYERYQLPPTKIKKLPDNVVVQIASLRRASRPHWMSADDRVLLEGWQKIQPAGIYFWRYYTYGQKGVSWLMPHLIAQSIKTMKEFNENGKAPVLGEMHFYRYDAKSRWWQNVNDYISAKMLWDPSLDCDQVLAEYYRDFYGPAAENMKTFFDLLEKNYMTYSDSSYIPKELAYELNGLLEKALKLTKGTEYAKRLQYLKDNFTALQRCVEIYAVEDKGITAPVNKEYIRWQMKAKGDRQAANHNVKSEKDGELFNGTDSYLQFYKPLVTDEAYTLEAWICPEDLEIRPVLYGESFNTYEPYYIFGSNMNDPTYNNVGVGIVGNCLMFNDINLGQVKSKPLDLKKGQWYHVAAVMDKKNEVMAIYLDGKLVGIETILRTMMNYDPTKIRPAICLVGAGGDNESKTLIKGCRGFFKGKIKDARIYRKSLNAAQILGRSKGESK